jgi:hypothetical protein
MPIRGVNADSDLLGCDCRTSKLTKHMWYPVSHLTDLDTVFIYIYRQNFCLSVSVTVSHHNTTQASVLMQSPQNALCLLDLRHSSSPLPDTHWPAVTLLLIITSNCCPWMHDCCHILVHMESLADISYVLLQLMQHHYNATVISRTHRRCYSILTWHASTYTPSTDFV